MGFEPRIFTKKSVSFTTSPRSRKAKSVPTPTRPQSAGVPGLCSRLLPPRCSTIAEVTQVAFVDHLQIPLLWHPEAPGGKVQVVLLHFSDERRE
jgi:hypothetical protein